MVLHESIERFGHVVIANVPCRRAAADHRAVVVLGVLDHERVLLGVEGGFALRPWKAGGASHLGEKGNDLVLAGRIHPTSRSRILLCARSIGLEALEGASGRCFRGWP